jgi:hypothetical protein
MVLNQYLKIGMENGNRQPSLSLSMPLLHMLGGKSKTHFVASHEKSHFRHFGC